MEAKTSTPLKMKGRFNNQPFLNQPKPKLNQKPNHFYMVSNTDGCSL
jgi:hypothetical protein